MISLQKPQIFSFIRTITILCLFSLSVNAADIQAQIDVERDYLLEIDQRSEEKWSHFHINQNDEQWLENQESLSLFGPIYQKGWLNPKVERQILPHNNELLVKDSIVLGPELVKQLAALSANFLLSSYLPFIQAAKNFEKRFTYLRQVQTYEQALRLKTFKLSTIPLKHDDLQAMDIGDTITTKTTDGFMARFSPSFMDLFGVEINMPIQFGPKVKIHYKKSLQISLTKKDDDIVIITIENTESDETGYGTGLGVLFEDIIELPISIGINGQNGYSPLVFNRKYEKSKIKTIIYEVDLSKEEGLMAYQSFLLKDFSLLQDLAKEDNKPVTQTFVKTGEISTLENNFGINLIFWRRGLRSILKEGNFKTTLANGNSFDYQEIELNLITDRFGFSGKEKEELKFMVMTPKSSHKNYQDLKGFTLDMRFFYHDTNTKGREITKLSQKLEELGIPNGLPVKLKNGTKYGNIQVLTEMRITPQGLSKVIDATDEKIWESIALVYGYLDNTIWNSFERRTLFYKKYFVDPSLHTQTYLRAMKKHLSRKDRKNLKKLRQLHIAGHVFKVIKKIKSLEKNEDKARELLQGLKTQKIGKVLYHTLIETAGLNNIMGQGYIRGDKL